MFTWLQRILGMNTSPENSSAIRLVEIAEKEIGVHEVGGNNRGPRVREYQSATWLVPGPWPWCAAFVCWAIREWLKLPEVRTALSLRNDDAVEKWRPKTAGAFDFENWAKHRGLTILKVPLRAKAGDLVIFNFSHIGIVAADQTDDAHISTIEGNTNNGGERDSELGDGVFRKERSPQLVKAFIRIVGAGID